MPGSMDMRHHSFLKKLKKLRKDFRILVSKRVENNRKTDGKH